MTFLFKLARRTARIRAPLALAPLFLAACDAADRLSPSDETVPTGLTESSPFTNPSFAVGFRGGMPFGVYHLPKAEYGATFNGSLANIEPPYVIEYLENARRSGARLILAFVGNERHYRNDDHSFSLAKWKQRLDPYKGIDLAPYVKDGTLIGHYLIDEPQDKSNWGGGTISPATLDEMAAYSKQLWPTVPTIVRTWPSYLKGRKYQHLDAAWAQYSAEGGASSQRLPIAEFMAKNVSEARESGLALVVGINLLAGGTSQGGLKGYYSDRNAAGAAELEQWGKVMLANPYPCAFIGWKYDSRYLEREDIKAAMATLSREAQNRPAKGCAAQPVQPAEDEDPTPPDSDPEGPSRPDDSQGPPDSPGSTDPRGSSGDSDDDDDDDDDEDESNPGNQPDQPPAAGGNRPSGGTQTGPINLKATQWVKAKRRQVTLMWTGITGREVDVYRDGKMIGVTENDGKYTNARSAKVKGRATYVYQVCARRSSKCSNRATVTFSR